MKKVKAKNLIKQIICIMLILMLCNFILPNYTFAVKTEKGGSLMEVIAQFLCFIPDSVMNILQDMFIVHENIKVDDDTYSIKYSPGVIFSGKVPAFDINFINPGTSSVATSSIEDYIIKNEANFRMTQSIDSDVYEQKLAQIKSTKYDGALTGREYMYSGDYRSTIKYDIYYKIDNNTLTVEIIGEFGTKAGSNLVRRNYVYGKQELTIADGVISGANVDGTPNSAKLSYESIASKLQSTIATWYNALRKIALVGLLSALVYVGIRIVLSSTSAKEKAKYKSMLKNWLVAICLLFTLHYIMSITITVVNKINEVISISSISADGEDVLMTSLRNKILNGEEWNVVLTYVVIYFVLAVYTVKYTIQYVKRVAYMAFLTMIAPLITLTYPLDKIKDNKAQAFDMWIKDYVFFALIQVVHLLIYYIFLGSAIDLASEGNWLFAIVAIGFITPAEKLIKKMFGFEKSKTLGSMAAGATGALMVNALQDISKGSQKESASEGNATATEVAKPVRTAGVNPFVRYTEETTPSTSPSTSGSSPDYGSFDTGSFDTGNFDTGSPIQPNSDKKQESKFVQALKNNKLAKSKSWNTFKSNAGRTIKGVSAVAAKYSAPMAVGTIRLVAKTTGGLIGFSAAVAEGGDASNIATKTTLGASATNGVVNVTTDTIKRVTKIPEKVDEAVDTYRAGAYGREVAENAKFDRVFRNSKEYKELREESGFTEKEFDKKVQKILDAGITDVKRMKKILKNHKLDPTRYNMDSAIKYSKLAKVCSKDILENQVKFIRFCQDRKLGISEEEMAELKKDIMNFK